MPLGVWTTPVGHGVQLAPVCIDAEQYCGVVLVL